jgi:alanine-alpha-ketoisovalerate/valine-pyruvate aminotransferase
MTWFVVWHNRYVAVVTIRTDLDAFANDDYVRLIVDGAYVDILPLSDLADMVSVVCTWIIHMLSLAIDETNER